MHFLGISKCFIISLQIVFINFYTCIGIAKHLTGKMIVYAVVYSSHRLNNVIKSMTLVKSTALLLEFSSKSSLNFGFDSYLLDVHRSVIKHFGPISKSLVACIHLYIVLFLYRMALLKLFQTTQLLSLMDIARLKK